MKKKIVISVVVLAAMTALLSFISNREINRQFTLPNQHK